ncbi:MAG: PLP-dependent aminotransferase family protein [Lachnospiraceae bacterium]|nr:PLP-dependent aminotransferase family protein [Lachnospiraceae bacterium]
MKVSTNITKQPLYLKIYQQLRDNIVAENYPYGSKLPSKRSLAEQMGVSTITVEHAYKLLCDEGYVEARERCGFLVLFRKSDGFALSPESGNEYSIPQHHSPYPDFPLSVLNKTIRKVLADYCDILLEKSPNCGCPQLREAISHYLARNRGIKVSGEQLIIGAGSEYLYRLIIELLGRDLIYAIEAPSYKKIEQIYEAAGITYERLPLTNTGIDSKALANTNALVLHTTPYRSYPTGVTATASKKYEYIRWSAPKNRYIIEDDFESEFSISAKPIETLFANSLHDNVIYLNTFSQTISSSIRIGYMVLPLPLVEKFHQNLGFYSCTVPTLMQYVLTELLNSGDFERHINRIRRKKRRELSV